MKNENTEIDGFVWSSRSMAWVDGEGRPASDEKATELDGKNADFNQKQIIQRLETVREIFFSMSTKKERKAAHAWLAKIHEL